jgi:hypothetical protein
MDKMDSIIKPTPSDDFNYVTNKNIDFNIKTNPNHDKNYINFNNCSNKSLFETNSNYINYQLNQNYYPKHQFLSLKKEVEIKENLDENQYDRSISGIFKENFIKI